MARGSPRFLFLFAYFPVFSFSQTCEGDEPCVADSRQYFVESEIELEWARFERYQEIICMKCERRGLECGCKLGARNPAVQVLGDFIARMQAARSSAGEYVVKAPDLKWIIAHFGGGMGNQHLQIVAGMMISLATGRLLAIDYGPNFQFDRQLYVYDMVFPLPSPSQMEGIEISRRREKIIQIDRESLEILTCTSLIHELGAWDIVDVAFTQTSHILLANPHHGDFFRDAFFGRPYFFLSHFLFMGEEARQEPVRFSTQPISQDWDGMHTPRDFMRLLRAKQPRLLIGVHSRIHSSIPFIHFDHRRIPGYIENFLGTFCKGSPESLDDILLCVGHLVRKSPRDLCPSNITTSLSRPDTAAVIFWASDNDRLTSSVLQQVQSLGNVLIIKIWHAANELTDREPASALLDMVVLEEMDVLIGSTGSTFSFLAHARGLQLALYPAFRVDRSLVCGAPTGTEGGLLFLGETFNSCHRADNVGGRFRVECSEVQRNCLQLMIGGYDMQACLADVFYCTDKNVSWARDYLIDIDHAYFTAQYLARLGHVLQLSSEEVLSKSMPPICPA